MDIVDPLVLYGKKRSEVDSIPEQATVHNVKIHDPLNLWKEFFCYELTDPSAISPEQKNGSPGYEFYSYETIYLAAWETRFINTKVKIHMPHSTYGIIGSHGNQPYSILHAMIQPDYMDEVRIRVQNTTEHMHEIKRGDYLATLVLHQYTIVPMKRTGNLSHLFRIHR
jgi:dUTPase